MTLLLPIPAGVVGWVVVLKVKRFMFDSLNWVRLQS
jgi:hypothetical protein